MKGSGNHVSQSLDILPGEAAEELAEVAAASEAPLSNCAPFPARSLPLQKAPRWSGTPFLSYILK